MNASELRQQQQQLNGEAATVAGDPNQQLIYTTSLVSCTIYDDGQGDNKNNFFFQLFSLNSLFLQLLVSEFFFLLSLFFSNSMEHCSLSVVFFKFVIIVIILITLNEAFVGFQ